MIYQEIIDQSVDETHSSIIESKRQSESRISSDMSRSPRVPAGIRKESLKEEENIMRYLDRRIEIAGTILLVTSLPYSSSDQSSDMVWKDSEKTYRQEHVSNDINESFDLFEPRCLGLGFSV